MRHDTDEPVGAFLDRINKMSRNELEHQLPLARNSLEAVEVELEELMALRDTKTPLMGLKIRPPPTLEELRRGSGTRRFTKTSPVSASSTDTKTTNTPTMTIVMAPSTLSPLRLLAPRSNRLSRAKTTPPQLLHNSCRPPFAPVSLVVLDRGYGAEEKRPGWALSRRSG